MAGRRRNGFDTTALVKYGEELEKLGGHTTLQRAVEGGMKATKQKVNPQIKTAMSAGNLPAGGGYSVGDTMSQFNNEFDVEWQGNMATIKLGFNLVSGGITSIFLMYGTPKMQPANGLREALVDSPAKISKKEMQAICKKLLERAAK